MKTAHVAGIVILIVVIAAIAFLSYRAPNVQQPPASKGTLELKATDAAVNVSSFNITISGIEIHRAGGGTEKRVNESTEGEEDNDTSSSGWITVLTGPKTIDLIQVKSVFDLLGEAQLDPGIYTQIRLHVSSAAVDINGTDQPLTVPSGVIRFNHPFRIRENSTTSVIIDFDADRSVVLANGRYMLKPVVKTITEFSELDHAMAMEKRHEQEDEMEMHREKARNESRSMHEEIEIEDESMMQER